jgi:hypothetical protein
MAPALAGDYKRGDTENLQARFVALQSLVEAIDRAMKEEREPHRPSYNFG